MNTGAVWIAAVAACALGVLAGIALRPHVAWVTPVMYRELTFSPASHGCRTHYFGLEVQFGMMVNQESGSASLACNEETTLGPTVRVICGCPQDSPDGGSNGE